MDINEQFSNKNKFLNPKTISKAILALLLIYFVLSKTDFQELFDLQNRVLYPWIVAGFGLFYLMTVLKAFQYHLFLKQDLSYSKMLNIVVIQNTVSNFVATGAGIASYFALSRIEQNVKLSRSGIAFLLTKASDVIAIWVFLLFSSFFLWNQLVSFQGFVIGLLLLMGVSIFILVLSILLRQTVSVRFRRWMERLNLGKIKFIRFGLDILDEIVAQDEIFSLRLLSLSTVYSLIYLFVTMVWCYANIRSFDIQIGMMEIIFVNVFLQLLSNIPIQAFGGLGVNESTSLYLYQFFYEGQQGLASVLIGVRILFYLMNLSVLLYFPLHKLLMLRRGEDS